MMGRLRWFWLLAVVGCYFETPTHEPPDLEHPNQPVDPGEAGLDAESEAEGGAPSSEAGQVEPVDAGMDAAMGTPMDATVSSDGGASPFGDGAAFDAGFDAGPQCACDAGKTVCIPETGTCVECNSPNSPTCVGDKPVCDLTTSSCVACNADTDCKSAAKAKCDVGTHTCAVCDSKMQCMHIPGLNTCNAGACVQCNASDATACTGTAKPLCQTNGTVCVACNTNVDCTDPTKPTCAANVCRTCQNDMECAGKVSGATTLDACYAGQCFDCRVNPADTKLDVGCSATTSCNPATRTCTGKTKGSIGICAPCLADAECAAGHRCITMTYQGVEVRPGGASGGFCLQRTASGTCNSPYGAAPISRASRSGAAVDSYCGVNESVATCDAIRAFGPACTSDSSCDIPEGRDALGARCETVTGAQRCTYSCGSGATPQCAEGYSCPSGTDSYCQ
jgi:hypothetical protein